MVRSHCGLPLAGATALTLLALAALVLIIAPASAESVELYEFEELSTTYGANAVSVRADGVEAVVVYSERINTTNQSTYTNYVFTTTGSSLSERAKYTDQSWYWRSAAFAPSGNTALLGGSQGKLYRYDGSSVRSVNSGIEIYIDIVVIDWHPTDGTAYLGTTTNRIYTYRLGSVGQYISTASSVFDLDVRPDGGEIAIAAYYELQLYNITRAEMTILAKPYIDEQTNYYYVYSVEYSLDGSYFLANWRDTRSNSYGMFRYANDKWHFVAKTTAQVEKILFENEGSFALLGMSNNLQYLHGGSVSAVSDWYTTGASGVTDLAFNTKDFYFLVGTPDGVFKFKRKDNRQPWLDRPIPDFEFNEDDPDGGDNLVDLSIYVRDDRAFLKLRFEFDFQQDPTIISGAVDGQFLDFTQVVENWNGKMTFRLKVWDAGSDDRLGTADDLFNRTNMFNVTVRQVNDPVSLASLGDKIVGRDDMVWFIEEGEWLNLSIVTVDLDNFQEMIQPPRFSFNRSLPTLKVKGTEMLLTFQPRNEDVGSVYVNLTVTDGFGSYFTTDLVFHISNVNNPPKLQGIRDKSVPEDQWLNFTVSAKDEDLDIGIDNYLTFSTNRTDGVGDDDLPNFSFVVDDKDPTRIKVAFLPTNVDVGDIDVEFRISDGFGAPGEWQDIKTMTITVENTNDAPELVEVNGVSTSGMLEFPIVSTEDVEMSVSFRAHDDDADPLFFYVDDSRFSISQPGAGYRATVTYTPTNDDVGNLFVTISVWDVFNTFDELALNISVQNVNDPPTLVTFEAYDVSGLDRLEFTLFEDVLFMAPIRVLDIDSSTIFYSDSSGIFSFDLSTDTLTAMANLTPTQTDVGEITTILEVDDGDGDVDVLTLVLTVVGTNDPPEVPTVNQLTFDSLTIPLRATRVTDPDGDSLNYTWDFGDHSPKESGIDLTDVTHTYPRSGTYQLVLTVDDGNDGVVIASYDVLAPLTGEDPPETEVQTGPVWFVATLIAVFALLAGVFLHLYWKLPKDGEEGM